MSATAGALAFLVAAAAMASVLALQWRTHPSVPGLSAWAAGGVARAAGAGLGALGGLVPSAPLPLAAAAVLVLAEGLLLLGASRFVGRRPPRGVALGVPVAVTGLLGALAWTHAPVGPTAALLSLAAGVLGGRAVLYLLHGEPRPPRGARGRSWACHWACTPWWPSGSEGRWPPRRCRPRGWPSPRR